MNRRKLAMEVTKEALGRQDKPLAMDLGAMQAERETDLQRSAEQVEREQMIIQSYEMAGQIKAMRMISKFGDVTSLMWLKQVKESKIYRDFPNIGTWEKYCEYLGLDRHTTDQDLLNITAFGNDFFATVTNLQVGYREMRKLRQLTHAGEIVIEDNTITIGDKTIPVDEDHAEDIQQAIEWILDENKTMSARVGRLEKDFSGALREETKGLQLEKKTLLKEVQRLKAFDPEEKDREWSVEQMVEIEKGTNDYTALLGKFIIDPRMEEDRNIQARVSGHLQEAEMMLNDLRRQLDRIINLYND